jgi:hypothetical protein
MDAKTSSPHDRRALEHYMYSTWNRSRPVSIFILSTPAVTSPHTCTIRVARGIGTVIGVRPWVRYGRQG